MDDVGVDVVEGTRTRRRVKVRGVREDVVGSFIFVVVLECGGIE